MHSCKIFEEGLHSGRFKPGTNFPTSADWRIHGISRAPDRKATRLLDVAGVILSQSGTDPKSGAIIVSEPSAGLSSTLCVHITSSLLARKRHRRNADLLKT